MKSFPKLIRSERERERETLIDLNYIFIGQIIEIPSIFFLLLNFIEALASSLHTLFEALAFGA